MKDAANDWLAGKDDVAAFEKADVKLFAAAEKAKDVCGDCDCVALYTHVIENTDILNKNTYGYSAATDGHMAPASTVLSTKDKYDMLTKRAAN